jgi:hypothetical protein
MRLDHQAGDGGGRRGRPDPVEGGQHAQLAAFVADQPGCQRAGRLGSRAAIDHDPPTAVADQQPGRRVARGVHRPGPQKGQPQPRRHRRYLIRTGRCPPGAMPVNSTRRTALRPGRAGKPASFGPEKTNDPERTGYPAHLNPSGREGGRHPASGPSRIRPARAGGGVGADKHHRGVGGLRWDARRRRSCSAPGASHPMGA